MPQKPCIAFLRVEIFPYKEFKIENLPVVGVVATGPVEVDLGTLTTRGVGFAVGFCLASSIISLSKR